MDKPSMITHVMQPRVTVNTQMREKGSISLQQGVVVCQIMLGIVLWSCSNKINNIDDHGPQLISED